VGKIITVVELDAQDSEIKTKLIDGFLGPKGIDDFFKDTKDYFIREALSELGKTLEEVQSEIPRGDNFRGKFQSPEEAHKFVSSFQKLAYERNQEQNNPIHELWFRIAAVTGEVGSRRRGQIYIKNSSSHKTYTSDRFNDLARILKGSQPGGFLIDSATFYKLPENLQSEYYPETVFVDAKDNKHIVRHWKSSYFPLTSTDILKDADSELEQSTLEFMRLFPGAKIERQKHLAGKRVENYCVISNNFVPDFRIAIECKNFHLPLTRGTTATIVSEYLPLLDQRLIDQFLLITREGLTADAREIFCGRRIKHLTITELADTIFDPTRLIDNMIRQFSAKQLDSYYIPQYAQALDLNFATSEFDLIYNDFIDFALEIGANNLTTAEAEWQNYTDKDLNGITKKYTSTSFKKILDERLNDKRRNLEDYVIKWVKDESISYDLAILGSYGTGKSSFAKRLAFVCAKYYRDGKIGRIPILIELKDFGSHQDVKGLVTHELVNRHRVVNGSFDLFESLNAAGRFLLILDGFDEMKQGMTFESLIYNFHQLSTLNVSKAKVVLCGRPTIFESQTEQTKIFRGDLQLDYASSAKYIQVNLLHFDNDEVCKFLLRYSKTYGDGVHEKVKKFVQDLKLEIVKNLELKSLVSRPVHLPMLASVIPLLDLHPSDIRRSRLYYEFINEIIRREMLKRGPEFQRSYSVEDRRRFATGIAVEMWTKGESRSLRVCEIPDSLIIPFARLNCPKEAVRRDLVSACFLERKPPDILFIPHKSFLEYLVAEYIVSLIKLDTPNTGSLGFKISQEIFSFVFEMTSPEDWVRVSENARNNIEIFSLWIQITLNLGQVFPHHIEEVWLEVISDIPSKIREKIVNYYENKTDGELSSVAEKILKYCLSDSSDVTAVHAYRALKKCKVTLTELHTILGTNRLIYWVIEKRWIQVDTGSMEKIIISTLLPYLKLIAIRKEEGSSEFLGEIASSH
jgi:hypothetical protein